MPSTMLTAIPANNGVSSNDRIIDTPSRTVRGIVEYRSRGRGRGGGEEDNPQMVAHTPGQYSVRHA